MPKEAVYGRMLPIPEGSDPEQPIVEVRWSREMDFVQVVSRSKQAECPSIEESENIPARYGWYVELDRRGINELIRNLRRARDQSFGRDE